MIGRRRRALPDPPKWRHNHWPARSVENFVISFPKSGRTWLRVMMAAAEAEMRGLPAKAVVSEWLSSDAPILGSTTVLFTHALSAPAHEPEHAVELYLSYVADKHRLFLVRDPRDVVVSHYFQVSRRARPEPGYEPGEIGEFVRDPARGIERVLAFYRACDSALQHGGGPSLVLAYEDLHSNPAAGLRAAVEFFGVPVADAAIAAAVAFGRFENMQRLERERALTQANRRLDARNAQDPESFKTRRGEIGGYARYLADEDVAYLEARIAELLPETMGYREPGIPPTRLAAPAL
jgi:hypothetical protein